jgi:diaminopimelate decarboxylase
MKMELIENHYEINGIKVSSLFEKYGLPLFVYDSSKIISQYNLMKNSFDVPNLKINFACKALTNLTILKLMQSLGAGLDVVSIQEIELGIRAGFLPQDILYTPNSVSLGEIEQAIAL